MNFYNLFFYFTIYSFLGWCSEVIYAGVKQKKFVNRGFLHGPFCPIYGFGALTILILIKPILFFVPENIFIKALTIFIYSAILTSILEYITGTLLEKYFNTTWWDYSDRKYNIKGRICLSFSIMWGIASVFGFMILHPQIIWMVSLIPYNVGIIIMYLLITYLLVDSILTIKVLINFASLLDEINLVSVELKERVKSNIEQLVYKAIQKKPSLASIDTLSERIKSSLKALKVNTDFKKYTLITNIGISQEIKGNIKKLRQQRILNNQKLLEKRQELHNKFIKRYSRLFKAFPNLRFKDINITNKKDEK